MSIIILLVLVGVAGWYIYNNMQDPQDDQPKQEDPPKDPPADPPAA